MKPCKDCPFVKKNPLNGSPEWLKDVLSRQAADPYFSHSCHKTDPKADGYIKTSKGVRQCFGHIGVMLNEIDPQSVDKKFWTSIKEMAETYLNSWLGELEMRKLRKEYHEKLRR